MPARRYPALVSLQFPPPPPPPPKPPARQANTGAGGPGYKFDDELPKAGQYKIGSLAMANSGLDTNGSQFFIITGAQGVALPPSYSLFGQVAVGTETTLEVLDAAGTASGTPKEAISITSVRITES